MNFTSVCEQSGITISEQELDQYDISEISPGTYRILYKNKNYIFNLNQTDSNNREIYLIAEKRKKKIKILDPVRQMIQTLGYNNIKPKHTDSLLAPMPGLVLEILVNEGDLIRKGDHLVTLEAMKMENILRASHDGKIRNVKVSKSEKVEKNQVLITFDNTI